MPDSSQHQIVNPVRPEKEQRQQWTCVPRLEWYGPPPIKNY